MLHGCNRAPEALDAVGDSCDVLTRALSGRAEDISEVARRQPQTHNRLSIELCLFERGGGRGELLERWDGIDDPHCAVSLSVELRMPRLCNADRPHPTP